MLNVVLILTILTFASLCLRRSWSSLVASSIGFVAGCLSLVIAVLNGSSYGLLSLPIVPAGIFISIFAREVCALLAPPIAFAEDEFTSVLGEES